MADVTELLLDQIVKIPPRETGGTIAANRADYQKSWAFCLLLTLHEKGSDYAMLLDFHDDVVVLNSSAEPTEMEFFQVKSKRSGSWTITQLLKCPKEKDDQPGKSICGKMYSNKLSFPTVTKSINFVSNARFKVRLKTDPKSKAEIERFDLQELAQEIADRYQEAMRTEHKLTVLAEVPTRFSSDPLACDGHREQAQGLFTSFLDRQRPGGKFAVVAAFRAVTSVIAKKSAEERKPNNRTELLERKAITRTDFSEMLTKVMAENEAVDHWLELNPALTAAHYSLGQIRRWRAAWNKYDIQRMDAANAALQNLKTQASVILETFISSNPDYEVRQLLETCRPELRQRLGAASPFDDDYLTAVLLYHSHETKPLSPPAS